LLAICNRGANCNSQHLAFHGAYWSESLAEASRAHRE
jgi:hypothetical protein